MKGTKMVLSEGQWRLLALHSDPLWPTSFCIKTVPFFPGLWWLGFDSTSETLWKTGLHAQKVVSRISGPFEAVLDNDWYRAM